MHTHGLTVDAGAIGSGIYAMIEEKGEAPIVAFGMVPLWAIESLRRALRDKIIAEAARRLECTPAELAPYIKEAELQKISNEIEHNVVLAIYDAAHRAGAMMV